jgi:hypothetical protein
MLIKLYYTRDSGLKILRGIYEFIKRILLQLSFIKGNVFY